jgi:uncharacterized membrane protein
MTPQMLIVATMSAAIAALAAGAASAQMHPEKPTYEFEKCYAVARAGMNDCFTPRNSCAGTTEQDADPQAWIYLPAGTCSRIVGASLAPR